MKNFAGPLSIKSVTEGSVNWKTGNQILPVDRNSFLVLNYEEPYSLEIDSREPVGTCCIFFAKNFVESLRASLTKSEAFEGEEVREVNFTSRLHLRDERLVPRLRLIAGYNAADPLWLDCQFVRLARDLLSLNEETRREMLRCPGLRPGTRIEVFRRLCRGREYLHAEFASAIDLKSCARAACLSPYHFQRAFKASFGRSPHAYLTELRLRQAANLLTSSRLSVTEITDSVGFQSSTSFTALFRRYFGSSPLEFRRSEIRKFG